MLQAERAQLNSAGSRSRTARRAAGFSFAHTLPPSKERGILRRHPVAEKPRGKAALWSISVKEVDSRAGGEGKSEGQKEKGKRKKRRARGRGPPPGFL